jgi:hypothetical protein
VKFGGAKERIAPPVIPIKKSHDAQCASRHNARRQHSAACCHLSADLTVRAIPSLEGRTRTDCEANLWSTSIAGSARGLAVLEIGDGIRFPSILQTRFAQQ